MTSFLRLNGITVPVATNSAPTASQETIGKMRRSVNATAVVPRRRRPGAWKFGTTPKTAAEALAWRELVAGAGHVLSFDTQNYYTSKGIAPVAVAAGWSFTTSGPKYGAACAQWTTGNALWAFCPTTSPWTVAWWLNQSGAGYHHYLQTSAGTKWIDGVLSPGGTMLGFGGVSSGVATFGSVTASKIDDIVMLPYVVPSDWPPQIFNFGSGFSLLPFLTADGLFIEQNTQVTVVGGEASGKLIPAKQAPNFHSFAFELFEK